jgi:hypothetical protein
VNRESDRVRVCPRATVRAIAGHSEAPGLASGVGNRRSGMNADVTFQQKDCAMVGCTQPAAPVPLVVNVTTMAGPFEIALCALCREPFEAGMEALERLVEGDAEAVPFTYSRRRETALEAQR